ncbi:hypothetical protein MLD38_036754 [Melastoma candidum]|uniref:Uncharacterized protein n=1 Tax=Melastoma candidum TaxID=119954 RepID=A0ACB9LK67_9MYRT|nr:hypothetical protein MLD38_036754 [Melastoma candidum]
MINRLGKVEYVVCRDDDGNVHAFHNVCRHHSSLLASGSGSKSCFVCPYHGWTYALNGSLLKATRIKGIRNFDVEVCLNSSLHFLHRREYIIKCNWKVFCDNYLDGGYHVPYAHKGLASRLKLDSYLTTLHDKVSLQCCDGGPVDGEYDFNRRGKRATYAFICPNFMINR